MLQSDVLSLYSPTVDCYKKRVYLLIISDNRAIICCHCVCAFGNMFDSILCQMYFKAQGSIREV